MKNMKNIEEFGSTNEAIDKGLDNSSKLATRLDDLISSIDKDMPYKDFANAVALVLSDQYGSHNYKPFVKQLEQTLKNL